MILTPSRFPDMHRIIANRAKCFRVITAVTLAFGILLYFFNTFNVTYNVRLRSAFDSLVDSFHRHRHHTSAPIDLEPFQKANATLLMLARNEDIDGVVASMKQVEDRFNRNFNYSWVFLNDQPFSEEFINRTAKLTNAVVSYGIIPRSQWEPPEWINLDRAKEGREKLRSQGVVHGGSLPYQNMCTFNSGFFYRHDLLKDYRYYWRVEPDVNFYCDLEYDPFLFMQERGKVYGFTITLYEFAATVPTLWDTVKNFTRHHPEYVHPNNTMQFLSDDDGKSYNLCHFWSNFEIADMDFWRDEAYSAYFDHLYKAGGFYYERWGDAPVHSIAAALFLPMDKLHFFSDIGYRHTAYTHCPQGETHTQGKCWCNEANNFDYDKYSCLSRYERIATPW